MSTLQDFEARRRARLQKQRQQRERLRIIKLALTGLVFILIIVIIISGIAKCAGKKKNKGNTLSNITASTSVATPMPTASPEYQNDSGIPAPSVGENEFLHVIKESGQKNHVYLTFDEGPNSSVTPQILDVLRRYNVKATFFMLGENIKSNPAMCSRVIREGHLAAPLAYSSSYSSLYKDSDSFIEQVDDTYELITENTPGGKMPFKIYRFPNSSANVRSEFIDALAENGYYYCDWNCSTGDDRTIPAEQQMQYFTTHRPDLNNLIIRMRDVSSNSGCPVMLDSLISQLLDEGYTFSRMDEIDFSGTNDDDSSASSTQAPSSSDITSNGSSSATAAPSATKAPSSSTSTSGAANSGTAVTGGSTSSGSTASGSTRPSSGSSTAAGSSAANSGQTSSAGTGASANTSSGTSANSGSSSASSNSNEIPVE